MTTLRLPGPWLVLGTATGAGAGVGAGVFLADHRTLLIWPSSRMGGPGRRTGSRPAGSGRRLAARLGLARSSSISSRKNGLCRRRPTRATATRPRKGRCRSRSGTRHKRRGPWARPRPPRRRRPARPRNRVDDGPASTEGSTTRPARRPARAGGPSDPPGGGAPARGPRWPASARPRGTSGAWRARAGPGGPGTRARGSPAEGRPGCSGPGLPAAGPPDRPRRAAIPGPRSIRPAIDGIARPAWPGRRQEHNRRRPTRTPKRSRRARRSRGGTTRLRGRHRARAFRPPARPRPRGLGEITTISSIQSSPGDITIVASDRVGVLDSRPVCGHRAGRDRPRPVDQWRHDELEHHHEPERRAGRPGPGKEASDHRVAIAASVPPGPKAIQRGRRPTTREACSRSESTAS